MQHRKRSSAESSPGQSVSVPGLHAPEAVQTHRSGAAQRTLSAAGGEAPIRTLNAREIISRDSTTSRQRRAVDGRIGRGGDAGHDKYDGLLQKDVMWHVQRLALPGGSDFSDDHQNDPGIIIPRKREDAAGVGTSGNFCIPPSFPITWKIPNRFDTRSAFLDTNSSTKQKNQTPTGLTPHSIYKNPTPCLALFMCSIRRREEGFNDYRASTGFGGDRASRQLLSGKYLTKPLVGCVMSRLRSRVRYGGL